MNLLLLNKDNKEKYFDTWLSLYQHPLINPFFFKPLHEPRDKMQELYSRYLSNSQVRFFLYLDNDDQPVATARVTYFEGARSHVAMINAVATIPLMQGKGYATRMLRDIEEFIKQDNKLVSQFELAWEGDNPAGYTLYIRKLGYSQKIMYQDWWIRHEKELTKNYPWYTSERCCVKYLDQSNPDANNFIQKDLMQKFDNPNFNHVALPPKEYFITTCDNNSIINSVNPIAQTYPENEQRELFKIAAHPNQTTYLLYHNTQAIAALSIRTYWEITRLNHSVTIPLIAFANNIPTSIISTFIFNAMQQYRSIHPRVFHFACNETDTEEIWFVDGHSKVDQLAEILRDTGFHLAGVFENYFNGTSHSGRNLIGFQFCFLGLKEAQSCIKTSNLGIAKKLQLESLVNNLLNYEDKLTHHEQYKIYQMIRKVIYPDYIEIESLKNILQMDIALLVNFAPNYAIVKNDLENLTVALHKIIAKMNQSLMKGKNVLLWNHLRSEEKLSKISDDHLHRPSIA